MGTLLTKNQSNKETAGQPNNREPTKQKKNNRELIKQPSNRSNKSLHNLLNCQKIARPRCALFDVQEDRHLRSLQVSFYRDRSLEFKDLFPATPNAAGLWERF
jgi:hypothetical protein